MVIRYAGMRQRAWVIVPWGKVSKVSTHPVYKNGPILQRIFSKAFSWLNLKYIEPRKRAFGFPAYNQTADVFTRAIIFINNSQIFSLLSATDSVFIKSWYVLGERLWQLGGPLTRYVKLRVAHATGMTGTFSPPPRVTDRDMHRGTCVTHVPGCMAGPLTSGFFWSWWQENVRHPRRMRNPQFYVSGEKPILEAHR